MAGDRANARNRQFREWLDEIGAAEQALPDGAFRDSLNQTGVNTKVLVIDKPAGDVASGPEYDTVPEDTLESVGLLRERRGRWQYRNSPQSGWMTANSKEDAVQIATEAYWKTPESKRLTRERRFEKASRGEFERMDRIYGNMSRDEIEQRLEKMGSDIAGLQQASKGEINNGRRRTGAAVAAESARQTAEERMRLERYYKNRFGDSSVKAFSRSSNDTDTTLPRDQVEAIATRITANWANGPEMVTVATDYDLPSDIQGHIDEQKARGQIDGVFHRGKFYLVADKIRTEADVERIVLHEALGHYGLRQLFGPAFNVQMDRLFDRVGGYEGIQRLGKKYGFDLSPYWENSGSMSPDQRRMMMADELIAHIAGTGTVEPDLIQRIAHLVRKGLRKLMAGTRFADRLNQMTDVEVLRVVAAAGGQ